MYLDFFSLERHPFRITPDPALFFHGGIRGRGVVLDALVYGITTGEGILKVVGEVGSGKTMLCRMLEECLPDTVEIVYLANPNLSARDIVYAVAFELRLDVDASTDRLIVMQRLQDYLLERHAAGAAVVVFIEEAQNMPIETLEEVRLLSNLETHRHKLMQIVLFGQPELDQKLQQKNIRQLKERITHSFNLEPLTADEIREYLHFRLKAAGCPWPQLFSPQAEKLLAKASGGLTRRINILADKSLLAAYADPATRPQVRNGAGEIQPMVHARHVKTAIADSDYHKLEPDTRGTRHYLGYAATLLLGIAIGAVLLWWQGGIGNGAPAVGLVPEAGAVDRTPQSAATAVTVTGNTAPAGAVGAAVTPEPEAVKPMDTTVAQAEDPLAQDAPLQVRDAEVAPAPQSAATAADVEAETMPATLPAAVAAEATQVTAAPEPVMPSGAVSGEVGVAASSGSAGSAELAVGSTAGASVIERTSEPATTVAEPANPERRPLPRVGRLAAGRLDASEQWLASLVEKTGYSIQMFAARTTDVDRLEAYLEYLYLLPDARIDEVYLCLLTGNRTRPEQWLVFYSETNGLSESRRLIRDLPVQLSQYAPYARNLDDIACANGAQ